jgi:transcriptional regulator with XRE-family HTH domain
LRQLAKLAGVSNPYLSQIERGLRKPSAEILQQIAKALRISAEALYVQAGILEERGATSDVIDAVLADSSLAERQKRVLVEIYESFRRENDGAPLAAATESPVESASLVAERTREAAATPAAAPARARRRTSKSSPSQPDPRAHVGEP